MLDFLLFMAVYLAAYVAMIYLSVPIHELGHLVCGLATGYRFVSFRLFSWIWYRENGRTRLRRVPTNRAILASACSPRPRALKNSVLCCTTWGAGWQTCWWPEY